MIWTGGLDRVREIQILGACVTGGCAVPPAAGVHEPGLPPQSEFARALRQGFHPAIWDHYLGTHWRKEVVGGSTPGSTGL